jgi:hypothetical protein
VTDEADTIAAMARNRGRDGKSDIKDCLIKVEVKFQRLI